jgi:hypothetical protein
MRGMYIIYEIREKENKIIHVARTTRDDMQQEGK